jgi:negative regulator of flagellin synthesis FlgM
MQIDNSGPILSLIQNTQEGNQAQQNGQANNDLQQQNSQATAQKDTVTFTNAAAQLQQLEKSLADEPVINTQRVAEVQNALNSGHKADPALVADKMLNFETGLNNVRAQA